MHNSIARYQSPMSLDQIRSAAPSVFSEAPRHDLSRKYAFIPTSRVLEGLMEEGFEVYAAGQTYGRRKQENKPFAKHMLRLRKGDGKTLRKVGDEFPEVVLTNSHDGTSAYQIVGGIFRLVCLNGMVVGRSENDVRVRHAGNVVDDVIEGSFRVVEELKHVAERVESYSAIQLDDKEQLLLAAAGITARWGENKIVTPEDVNEARRHADRGDDLWSTFNRIQENIVKGGQDGISSSGRKVRTRSINSVSADINLNRALFTLADEFAKLKAAS